MNNKIVSFIYCFFPSIFFIVIKIRPELYGLLRGDMVAYRYNWEGFAYHTLIFLFLLSLDMFKYLFVLKWKSRFLNGK